VLAGSGVTEYGRNNNDDDYYDDNTNIIHRIQNSSGARQASYPMGTRGSFPVGKAGGA